MRKPQLCHYFTSSDAWKGEVLIHRALLLITVNDGHSCNASPPQTTQRLGGRIIGRLYDTRARLIG